MGDIRLSVIVPTCGRSTLENTVQSVMNQMRIHDELIIVGSRVPEQFPSDMGQLKWGYDNRPGLFQFLHRDNKGCRADNSTMSGPKNQTHGPQGTESGAVERDMGDAVATGTHLLHIDDDDIFVKDAFEKVRAAIAKDPNRVLIFRMEYGIKNQWISPYSIDIDGVPTLGVQERVALAAFGGMEMVFPRVSPNPRWEQEGEMRNSCEDYFNTKRYLEALGTEPVWPRKTIGIVRPTREQILFHTGRDTNPLYAPQPAWNGVQQRRMKCGESPLRPEVLAAMARRRAGKK
jgi:hypothetical protein